MFGSLLFLIHESWLNFRRQGLLVAACVTTAAVSLTILGIFVLLAWQVHTIAEAIPRRFEIHAFLRQDATRAQAEQLRASVESLPGVARVRLIPREQAWAEFQKHYPHQDDLEGMTENPLPDKLEVVAASPSETLRLAGVIRGWREIDRVNEGGDVLRQLLAIAGLVRIVGLCLAVFLALGTAAILANAIRMTLFARRRDIRVMQLVGATNGFIRMPFVLEGIVEGALGGALAGAVMAFGFHYLQTRVLPGVPLVSEFRLAVDVPRFCASLVAGGALLGMLGSLVSLRRFLRAE